MYIHSLERVSYNFPNNTSLERLSLDLKPFLSIVQQLICFEFENWRHSFMRNISEHMMMVQSQWMYLFMWNYIQKLFSNLYNLRCRYIVKFPICMSFNMKSFPKNQYSGIWLNLNFSLDLWGFFYQSFT